MQINARRLFPVYRLLKGERFSRLGRKPSLLAIIEDA